MKKIFVGAFCCLLTLTLGSCKAKSAPESRAETSAEMSVAKTEPGTVIHLTTEEFLAKVFDYKSHPETFVYEGSVPCIVDFYATWCRPCKMLAPTIEELAGIYAGKVIFYKVDVDAERELSNAFGIQSIPTLLFVPLTGTPAMQPGMMSREQLIEVIDSYLLGEE